MLLPRAAHVAYLWIELPDGAVAPKAVSHRVELDVMRPAGSVRFDQLGAFPSIEALVAGDSWLPHAYRGVNPRTLERPGTERGGPVSLARDQGRSGVEAESRAQVAAPRRCHTQRAAVQFLHHPLFLQGHLQ
jgi:hypothetical protein